MAKRVTLTDIAAKLGIHYSTVSLALRNSRLIPEATRAKVRRTARKLGYTPDPMLAALANYRKSSRPESFHGVIGVIAPEYRKFLGKITRTPFEKANIQARQSMLGSMEARAHALGYKIEYFDTRHDYPAPENVIKAFRARNISQVIVLPHPWDMPLKADLSSYTVVVMSNSRRLPEFHRVSVDQFENMRQHLDLLSERGYQRIAIILRESVDARTRHNWRAAFLLHCDARKRAKLIFRESDCERLGWPQFMTKHKPDVLICESHIPGVLEYNGFRVPDDVHCSLLSVSSYVDAAGWNEGFNLVAEESVSRVVALWQMGIQGFPVRPNKLLFTGEYQEGGTAPTKPRGKPKGSTPRRGKRRGSRAS